MQNEYIDINELRQNITDVNVSLQNIITTDIITNAYIDIITPNIDNNFIANADDLIQSLDYTQTDCEAMQNG